MAVYTGITVCHLLTHSLEKVDPVEIRNRKTTVLKFHALTPVPHCTQIGQNYMQFAVLATESNSALKHNYDGPSKLPCVNLNRRVHHYQKGISALKGPRKKCI